jgi:hypothetical protein
MDAVTAFPNGLFLLRPWMQLPTAGRQLRLEIGVSWSSNIVGVGNSRCLSNQPIEGKSGRSCKQNGKMPTIDSEIGSS